MQNFTHDVLVVNNVPEVRWRLFLVKMEKEGLECNLKKNTL